MPLTRSLFGALPLHGLAIAATLGLTGCQPAAAPGPRPLASLQEIMQSIVDPAADALWESVSSTVTAAGVEEHQPRSDEDWNTLRHHAVRLAEAANLLATEGRPVARAGKPLEDAHVAGTLDADAIAQRLASERPRFLGHARQLQDAAETALAAIDTRNLERFLEAGANIDKACEGCHRVFWYPGDKRPPELAGPPPR